MKVPWAEHWEFIDSALDIRSAEGLQTIDRYLSDLEKHAPVPSDLELMANSDLTPVKVSWH